MVLNNILCFCLLFFNGFVKHFIILHATLNYPLAVELKRIDVIYTFIQYLSDNVYRIRLYITHTLSLSSPCLPVSPPWFSLSANHEVLHELSQYFPSTSPSVPAHFDCSLAIKRLTHHLISIYTSLMPLPMGINYKIRNINKYNKCVMEVDT